MANLIRASLLWGPSLCFSLWGLELVMDHYTHLASLWFPEIKILGLTLAWQTLNH